MLQLPTTQCTQVKIWKKDGDSWGSLSNFCQCKFKDGSSNHIIIMTVSLTKQLAEKFTAPHLISSKGKFETVPRIK